MARRDLIWSEIDTNYLITHYNSLTAEELIEKFPQRSIVAIRKKAIKCGLHVSREMEYVNRSKARSGENGANWNGGKRQTSNGYVQLLMKDHPRSDLNGYVMEHIVVWERETGIPVKPEFVIHHLDGNKKNNDISNLCLMKRGAHTTYHNRLKRRKNNA